jgi:phosphoserine phosphatase RsbU/P
MAKQIIICVDDEKIVLDSLKKELKQALGSDIHIEVAESGEEAIDILQESIEDGNETLLIISDYIMPGIKGDEVLQKVKELNPDTYRIMLTGQATIDGVTNAINNAGLYRYISKPWETNDLSMTINEALKSYHREKHIKVQNEEILKKNKEITEINLHLEDLVKIRTAELEDKKQEILDSINYSKRIQMAIMGDIGNIKKQFPFASILYRPRDVVSGDFYWYAQKDNKTILVAADCTGHGVPGAFMSIVGMSSLNQIVNEKDITSPDQILNLLRNMIMNILWQTGAGSESKDGMDISVIVLDKKNNVLEYSGAFNSLYLLRDDFSDFDLKDDSKYVIFGKLLEIKADRMPIGISDFKDSKYTLHRIILKPDDVIYISTDGYKDQFGGPQSKKMLAKRFMEKMIEVRNESIDKQTELLTIYYNEWKGDNEQVDDVLVIGVKIDETFNLLGNNSLAESQAKSFFEYHGEINREIISEITEKIENKLLDISAPKQVIKKMNIILIELLQNSFYYLERNSRKLKTKEFSLVINKHEELFRIECYNTVLPPDFSFLKEKIEQLNKLTKDEIQDKYKKQLDEGKLPENHGAGLGFIVIAKRVNLPINCDLLEKGDNHLLKLSFEFV